MQHMHGNIPYILFKWANPDLFLVIFGNFKQTIQFLQQIYVKNVQMSIQYMSPGFKPTTF